MGSQAKRWTLHMNGHWWMITDINEDALLRVSSFVFIQAVYSGSLMTGRTSSPSIEELEAGLKGFDGQSDS